MMSLFFAASTQRATPWQVSRSPLLCGYFPSQLSSKLRFEAFFISPSPAFFISPVPPAVGGAIGICAMRADSELPRTVRGPAFPLGQFDASTRQMCSPPSPQVGRTLNFRGLSEGLHSHWASSMPPRGKCVRRRRRRWGGWRGGPAAPPASRSSPRCSSLAAAPAVRAAPRARSGPRPRFAAIHELMRL